MPKRFHTLFDGDLAGAACLLALGGFILFKALDLAYTSDVGPGPGFLPFWLGAVIAGLSLLLIFTAARKRPRAVQSRVKIRSLVSWLAIMIGIGLLPALGFYVSFAILTAFFVFAMENRPVAVALAVAAASGLGFYLIFSLALGVPMPAGPWGF
ncbi:MAG TPA: tripartite tricarboxylate transporter TctB family protein [Candidatus Acidoferrales bacterium]|nr:tripartite tricarboxylate transporter TctB family protein [Candidatus Acidoferrales bacterium]